MNHKVIPELTQEAKWKLNILWTSQNFHLHQNTAH